MGSQAVWPVDGLTDLVKQGMFYQCSFYVTINPRFISFSLNMFHQVRSLK